MTRKLIINQITLCADGSVGVQWMKQIVEGDEVIFSEPHRTVVDFAVDDSGAAQLDAALSDLGAKGYSITNAQRARFRRLIKNVIDIGKSDDDIQIVRQQKIELRRVEAERLAADEAKSRKEPQ